MSTSAFATRRGGAVSVSLVVHAALTVVALFTVIPFAWLVCASFKT